MVIEGLISKNSCMAWLLKRKAWSLGGHSKKQEGNSYCNTHSPNNKYAQKRDIPCSINSIIFWIFVHIISCNCSPDPNKAIYVLLTFGEQLPFRNLTILHSLNQRKNCCTPSGKWAYYCLCVANGLCQRMHNKQPLLFNFCNSRRLNACLKHVGQKNKKHTQHHSCNAYIQKQFNKGETTFILT